MNRNLILILLWLTVAAIACKKEAAKEPGKIKKIVVTTVAGDGTKDFLDGPALSAKFAVPFDVAVAADGTIYVSDASNHRIRKIKAGQVSTFAGNGTKGIVNANGSLAQFKDP